MSYKELTLTLGNPQGQTKELHYRIRNTVLAQLWADCLKKAEPEGLRETHRFYNFPDHERSSLGNLLELLESNMKILKNFHPDLHFPDLDPNNLQVSVNNLHFNFAHSHHVEKRINFENAPAWSEFNVLLHAIESVLSNLQTVKRTGLNGSHIITTFNNPNHIPIPSSEFDDFVVSFDFGTAYINYAHVGRHFFEMFRAQDEELADEHIQPSSKISADTFLYFGPTTGHSNTLQVTEQMRLWFQKHEKRFNRLGFFWGDPKLALGQVPVAQITDPLYSIQEINQLVGQLSLFNKVLSLQVN